MQTGATYAVSASSQPAIRCEICAVSNGSGVIAAANMANVAINCSIVVGFLYQLQGTSGQILSYGISPGTGAPLPFGSPIATGSNPFDIVTTHSGNFLYVNNFGSNSISIYAVNSDTGALTPVGSPVAASAPRQMLLSASGFLFIYGNSIPETPGMVGGPNTLNAYAVDAATGALTPTGTLLTFAADSGTGLAVTPDGKFLYVLNGCMSCNTPSPITLTAYDVDNANGALTAGPVITLDTNANTIAIDPLGRFLYLTSSQTTAWQATATVLPYAIDSNTGALTAIGTGTSVASNAGGLAADPTGRYLYIINNLNFTPSNDTVAALAVDQSSGTVSPIGAALPIDGQPFSIVCDPSGRFVYVGSAGSNTAGANSTWNDLAAFAISSSATPAGQLLPSGSGEQFGSNQITWSSAMAVIE